MVLALWWSVLYLFIVGLAAGWFAWVVLGKNKSLSREGGRPNWTLLLALGVAGSFAGGLAISLLQGQGLELRPSAMIGSLVGAVAVTALYLALKGRK